MISNSDDSISNSSISSSISGEESNEENDLEWSPLEGVLNASTADLHAAYGTHDLSTKYADPTPLSSKSSVELFQQTKPVDLSPIHVSRSAMEFWDSSGKVEEAVDAKKENRRAVQV